MWYRLETWSDYSYEPIYKKYKDVLEHFSVKESNGRILIKIDSSEELFKLDLELRNYFSEEELGGYFGVMISNDIDGQLICIKDNYD